MVLRRRLVLLALALFAAIVILTAPFGGASAAPCHENGRTHAHAAYGHAAAHGAVVGQASARRKSARHEICFFKACCGAACGVCLTLADPGWNDVLRPLAAKPAYDLRDHEREGLSPSPMLGPPRLPV